MNFLQVVQSNNEHTGYRARDGTGSSIALFTALSYQGATL
jgi:hypothetical protein